MSEHGFSDATLPMILLVLCYICFGLGIAAAYWLGPKKP